MQAIVKTHHRIQLQEKELPTLNDDSNVLIKVKLAGLCRTDTFVAQNKISVAEGITLGHEFTGTIHKMGSKVTGIKIGQRVGIMPVFVKGPDSFMLGIHQDGAFAEYIRVPASNIYAVPEHLSDEEVAFLEPIAASLSVIHAGIQPHQRGFIYGKNRIAELTRRILNIKGFYAIDVLDEDETLIHKDQYDFAIETAPTIKAFDNMLPLIKRKGLIILKSRPYQSIPLPVAQIVAKEITMIGAYYADFQESIDLLASKALIVSDLFNSTYPSFVEVIPILLGERPYPNDKKMFIKPE